MPCNLSHQPQLCFFEEHLIITVNFFHGGILLRPLHLSTHYLVLWLMFKGLSRCVQPLLSEEFLFLVPLAVEDGRWLGLHGHCCVLRALRGLHSAAVFMRFLSLTVGSASLL